MKFYKSLLLLLLCPIGLLAQTSVTATLTDSDSQTWNNGTWSALLISPSGPAKGCTTATTVSGTMNGSGFLTGSLCDTTLVSPSGAQWRFTLCPNASAGCSVVTTAVSGASESLSTVLSAGLTAPRFPAGNGAFGYLDAEVITTPQPGGTYYNVTTPALRIWSGSAWSTVGAGSAGIANITVTLPTSALTANTCSTPATATMTGLATTSAFDTAFATNPNAVNGWGSAGGLVFTAWPTANTLNWSVCNTTSSSITPGAMTLNVGAK